MPYNAVDAFFADLIYRTGLAEGEVYLDPGANRWRLERTSADYGDGYQGALFKNVLTGEYKFASRGTEPTREFNLDVLQADLQMGLGSIPTQASSQTHFFDLVKNYVRSRGGDPTEITLVGDSLGGSLVMLLGAANPSNPVHAFNPYGIGNLVPEGTYANITMHVLAGDPVSVLPGSRSIGTTYMYNEPDNPHGDTSPTLASHVNREIWLASSVTAQVGTRISIDAYSPLNWIPGPDGGGVQGDPATGLFWPGTPEEPLQVGGTYKFPDRAGAGRGLVNPPAVVPPAETVAPVRNSADYIVMGDNHTASVREGGTVWDIWNAQNRGFGTWREFEQAVMASNPQITDINRIRPGDVIQVPERHLDGSISYYFANGTYQRQNTATGEYQTITPTADGGTITYERERDGETGYLVRQITADAQGRVVEQTTSYQEGRDGALQPLSRQRINDDLAFEAWDGYDPFSQDSVFAEDTAGRIVVNVPNGPLNDIGALFDAEERFQNEYLAGWLSADRFHAFEDFVVDYSLAHGIVGGGGGLGLQPPPAPGFWADPIGAFYDSQSPAFDNAPSIAAHTGVLLDANRNRIGFHQASALDSNGNGIVEASEAQGLSLWRDLNENGLAETGEVSTWAESGRRQIGGDDWALLTQGASPSGRIDRQPAMVPMELNRSANPARPLAVNRPVRPLSLSFPPTSDYRRLRDTDNIYILPDGRVVTWGASQVKISYAQRNTMVGTDGNDAFDANTYQAYSSWFNLALLTRFMGGGGDDVVGGSSRNDHIWGGTGNDTLWGYEGNDRLYGEEGQDALVGQAGDDWLDGGIGNDQLFGGVGNDTLHGGEGDDTLVGFNPTNNGPQTLTSGETDNDWLFSGNGNDHVYGADGSDIIDGGAGNDNLHGQAGNDEIWAGEGDDDAYGGEGNDLLVGEAGDDYLFGQAGNDILWGGDGNDLLLGSRSQDGVPLALEPGETDEDMLLGEGGNDDLRGGGGNDRLDGGSGDDELQGGEGQDVLSGDSGNDRMFGQVGNDTLWGGEGNDVLVGFTASNEAQQTLLAGQTDDDVIFGEAGDDDLYGFTGADTLDGGTGDDLLFGGDGLDQLLGGDGKDELQGGGGNDQMMGGAGDDRMFGQEGSDVLWGGDGNDLLIGFTGSNEAKQALAAGETDDDLMIGGAGSDVLMGGLGSDTLHGGTGRDELQGNVGDDVLYGEQDSDNLFGQAGDDLIYGGEGDDYLMGFTGSNEAQQVLADGETDNDRLYGGAGHDTLVGGWGHDWLDGGAGADIMDGGAGDDSYIVNSVNDVVYEAEGGGHDSVYASTSYLLSANVEDLILLEGFSIHGTGNAQDNLIVGNSADNILDGITGADRMIGGLGDDTFYVDDAGDWVGEVAGEGVDTVQSSISYSLSADVENLVLLDFSKPERGLVDGREVLVYGYPKRNELDYMQGNAVPGFRGTCALTSIANVLTQTGQPTTESQVIDRAVTNGWTVSDPSLPASHRGGTTMEDQRQILDSYGVRHQPVWGYNESGLANLLRGGRGILVGLNAGVLWDDPASREHGGVNHAVTLTGAVHAQDSGELVGFFLSDSGRGRVNDMTRFVDIETFRAAANVEGAYALFTLDPVKLWDEDLIAVGNHLDNMLVGNRGHNQLWGKDGNDVLQGDAGDDLLSGGGGDDHLAGGTGNDTYRFGRGDGQDRIVQAGAHAGDEDMLKLGLDIDCDQIWFSRAGDDLALDIIGTHDRVTLAGWFSAEAPRVGEIRTHHGWSIGEQDVQQLVQAMAGSAPPPAGEVRIDRQREPMVWQVVASSWHGH